MIAEVLIAYQKYQLKKRYVEELDEYEARKKNNNDEEEEDERGKGKEERKGKGL